MTSVLLREADPTEFGAVGDVLEEAFTNGCWITEEYRQGLHRIAERAESSHVWVIENSNHDLVAAVLTPRQLTGDVSTFNILGVSPQGRGHGLGHLLVDHAIEQAAALGARTIEINSSPHMTFAHRLYYDHGFVRRPEQETAVVDSGQRLFAFSLRLEQPESTPIVTASARDYNINEVIEIVSAASGIDTAAPFSPVAEEIKRDLLDALPIIANEDDPQDKEAIIRLFYARLGFLDFQLSKTGAYLYGDTPGPEDALLFAVLVTFDLRWREHCGWGAASIRDYPHLWTYARRLADQGFLSDGLRQLIGLVNDPTEVTSPGPRLTTGNGHNDLVAAWSVPA